MNKTLALTIAGACLVGLVGLATHERSIPFASTSVAVAHQEKERPKKQQAKAKKTPKAGSAKGEKLPKTLGELPAERVSAPAPQADFPAVAVTEDGAVWVSYLEWSRGETDRVVVRRQGDDGMWASRSNWPTGVSNTISRLSRREAKACWRCGRDTTTMDSISIAPRLPRTARSRRSSG